MSYKLRNNLFTVLLLLILAFVIFFAVWKLAYGNLACKPIITASETYGMNYNDLIHTYQGVAEKKFDVSFVEPTLLKFNATANVGEKSAYFYKASGGSQIVLTLSIAPSVGGDSFKYIIQFDEIVSASAATKTDMGNIVIDRDTFKVLENNASGVSVDKYSSRIEKLVAVADSVWGDSILED